MRHCQTAILYLSIALWTSLTGSAGAQDVVKVGLVMPMTGALAAAGRETVAGAQLYMAQHGNTVAGKKNR